MKIRQPLLCLCLAFAGLSCSHEPAPPHEYEQDPNYTYMGAAYYGQYYLQEGIDSHVFSLTLYSEGMVSPDSTAVSPPGQELYLEDLFIPEANFDNLTLTERDTVLTEAHWLALLRGTYRVSGGAGQTGGDAGGDTDTPAFGTAFTFAPGEYQKVDSITYILGARITYYEEDDFYSKRLLIAGGTMTVNDTGIAFDLLTDDGRPLYGHYTATPGNTVKITSGKGRKRTRK